MEPVVPVVPVVEPVVVPPLFVVVVVAGRFDVRVVLTLQRRWASVGTSASATSARHRKTAYTKATGVKGDWHDGCYKPWAGWARCARLRTIRSVADLNIIGSQAFVAEPSRCRQKVPCRCERRCCAIGLPGSAMCFWVCRKLIMSILSLSEWVKYVRALAQWLRLSGPRPEHRWRRDLLRCAPRCQCRC